MVSVNKLRLISALETNSPTQLEPTISDKGRIEYGTASDVIGRYDESVIEALDSLAERGLLEKEYTIKVYLCPSCQTKGMQYITACTRCESTHSIYTSFITHDTCEYTDRASAFERTDNAYQCPSCETEADSSDVTIEQRHLCMDCNTSFATPERRLWCRNCRHLCPLDNATERTLYNYTLSEDGRKWHATQIEARETAVEALESRGFDVSAETPLPDAEDPLHTAHIYAQDELLGQELVMDIHSAVDQQKIEDVETGAQQTTAKPMLLLTDLHVSEEMLHAAAQQGVLLIVIDPDGSLRRLQLSDSDAHSDSNRLDVLTSAIDIFSQQR